MRPPPGSRRATSRPSASGVWVSWVAGHRAACGCGRRGVALDLLVVAERGGAPEPVAFGVVADLDPVLHAAHGLRFADDAAEGVALEQVAARGAVGGDELAALVVGEALGAAVVKRAAQ